MLISIFITQALLGWHKILLDQGATMWKGPLLLLIQEKQLIVCEQSIVGWPWKKTKIVVFRSKIEDSLDWKVIFQGLKISCGAKRSVRIELPLAVFDIHSLMCPKEIKNRDYPAFITSLVATRWQVVKEAIYFDYYVDHRYLTIVSIAKQKTAAIETIAQQENIRLSAIGINVTLPLSQGKKVTHWFNVLPWRAKRTQLLLHGHFIALLAGSAVICLFALSLRQNFIQKIHHINNKKQVLEQIYLRKNGTLLEKKKLYECYLKAEAARIRLHKMHWDNQKVYHFLEFLGRNSFTQLSDIIYDSNQIQLTGTTTNYDAVEAQIGALKQLPFISTLILTQLRRQSKSYLFELSISLAKE